MMSLAGHTKAAEDVIKGTIVTDNGKPLPYAYVTVEGKPYATQADKNGAFTLNLPEGTYQVKASLLGYRAETKQIASGTTGAGFFLKEDLINLNALTVTGTRTPKLLRNTPVVTQIITADDIRKIDATNIKDVLTTELPGLEFTYSMDQQVSLTMQGLGGMSILILVDGERLAGETLDNTDFQRLNMDNVERIEIVKGAASALYGSNSVGAVINIITKKATEPWSVNLNTHFGTRYDEQRHGGSIGVNKGRWNSLTDVQTNSMSSYKVTDNDGTQTTVYGNRQWNFKEKLSYRVSDKMSLTAKAGYYFHERDKSPSLKDHARDFSGSLRLTGDLTENDHLDVIYTFDRYDKSDYYPDDDLDFLDYKNVQNSVRALYTRRFADKLTWTSGGDGMIDFLKTYQFADGGNKRQYTADIFTQADWNIDNHWNLVTGIRADYFSHAGWDISPKVALMYKVWRMNFRGSYSHGFRAPTLKEMYMDFNMANIFDIYGNPDLKAEKSHSFALSAEYAQGRYSLTATGYYNIMNNRITTVWDKTLSNGRGAMVYQNIEGSNLLGTDVTFMARYPCGIGAKVSYAYFHEFTRHNAPSTSDTRPHSLTVKVDYGKVLKNYEFNVMLTGRFLSWMKYYTISDDYASYSPTTSPAYTMWKLTFSQRIYKTFRLIMGVDNLFAYKPETYSYNSPYTLGRTFSVGLSMDVEQLFKKK